MKVRSEKGKLVQISKQMPVGAAEGEFIGMAAFNKEGAPRIEGEDKAAHAGKGFYGLF